MKCSGLSTCWTRIWLFLKMRQFILSFLQHHRASLMRDMPSSSSRSEQLITIGAGRISKTNHSMRHFFGHRLNITNLSSFVRKPEMSRIRMSQTNVEQFVKRKMNELAHADDLLTLHEVLDLVCHEFDVTTLEAVKLIGHAKLHFECFD